MEIGLIVSAESGNTPESNDLIKAISDAKCKSSKINIENIVVRVENKMVSPFYLTEFTKEKRIDVDAAVLRSIGIVKDYEQFSQRIWAIRSIEMNDIYVSNNIFSYIAASDKLGTLMQLARSGIPVPPTLSSESFFSGYGAVKEFKTAVVKPLRSGKGLGIFKVEDPDVAMHMFSYFTNLSKPIYVQKFLEKVGGGDYRIIVVGDEVIGAEFRKSSSWKSNISQGAKGMPAKLNSELRELAIKSTKAMKLDYAGIDIAQTKDGYFVLETNTTIGWQTFKQVTKVNPAKYIIADLIKKAKS